MIRTKVAVGLITLVFCISSFQPAIVMGLTANDIRSIRFNTTFYQEEYSLGCAADPTSGDVALTGSDNAQKTFNYFISKGLSEVQSAAIVGNFMQESSVNPKSNQDGGPGMGIAQWTNPGRWNDLEQAATLKGVDKFELSTQLDFVWMELTNKAPAGDYSGVLAELKRQTDTYRATAYFMGTSAVSKPDPRTVEFMNVYGKVSGYENPGTPELQNRIDYADGVLAKYGTGREDGGAAAVTGIDASCGSVGSVDCTNPDASTTGLSQARQNVVCLTQAELKKWDTGEMGPGTDFYTYSQGRDENWCADFVSWIYKQADYPLSGDNEGNVPAVQTIRDIGEAGNKFEYHAAGSYIPTPGDIVVYQDGWSHVNIVVAVNKNNNTMSVIGGNQDGSSSANTSSKVTQYSINGYTGSHITGYVSPKE